MLQHTKEMSQVLSFLHSKKHDNSIFDKENKAKGTQKKRINKFVSKNFIENRQGSEEDVGSGGKEMKGK